MGTLTKGMIGKEDFEIQYNSGVAETFSRTSSAGGTLSLTKVPDLWGGTGALKIGNLVITGGTAHGDFPFYVKDAAGNNLFAVEKGSVEGANYGTVYIPNGDLLNVRNIQGGYVAPYDLDIAAGSAVNRGNVHFNYDCGNGVMIYDGRTNVIATFSKDYDSLIHYTVTQKYNPVTDLVERDAYDILVGLEAEPRFRLLLLPTGEVVMRRSNGVAALVDSISFAEDGKVGVGIATTTSPFAVLGLAEHANNAAASGAGLQIGDFYRVAGTDAVAVVHA